jgi:DNA-binding transcriptional MerR regulator
VLTISQLASYAGVTVRAIRHYHERGLLAEPPRDASGYRRYDARAVITLATIKTLADAGVPLGRIPPLLVASPEELDAAIGELDIALAARIDELAETRLRLRMLGAGSRFGLPDRVVRHLDRIGELGLTEAQVLFERDIWILLVARYPERIEAWLDRVGELLDDADVAGFYVDLHLIREASPEDPRLTQLATRAAKLLRRAELRALRLVNEFGDQPSAAWSRLVDLADAELRQSSVDDR